MALDGHWATFFLMTLFVGIDAGLGYRLHDSFHKRLGDFSLGIKIFSCFRFTNDLKIISECNLNIRLIPCITALKALDHFRIAIVHDFIS